MKKWSKARMEQRLRDGAERLSREQKGAAESLWTQPVQRARGDEWYLDGVPGIREKRRSGGKWLAGAASAVAVCAVVCLLSYFMLGLRTDATIYLDVNPSIQLEINRREKVTRVEANNRDGEIILEDMDLKNADLDVAVNALLGSMVKHGYLNEAQNMILLSVDSRDPDKADALRLELTDEINACMDTLVGSGAIFDQGVRTDPTLEELAATYGITPGKAALIQKLVEANAKLDYGELAGLSMNELVLRLGREGIDLRDFVNYTGKSVLDVPEQKAQKAKPKTETEAAEEPAASGKTSTEQKSSAGQGDSEKKASSPKKSTNAKKDSDAKGNTASSQKSTEKDDDDDEEDNDDDDGDGDDENDKDEDEDGDEDEDEDEDD